MSVDAPTSSLLTTRAEERSPTLPERGGEVESEARPARIGRFVVLRKLGEGGMGVVYAAYDEELERKVAIKLLRTDFHGQQQSVGQARLLREAQAMAKLSHPNVAQVYDVGQVAGAVFIAMEFVSGGNLREWLQRADRPWRAIVAAYVQAGHGLAAAHAAGIVHRDFKPDNVLVGDDERVRVVDFGLARPGEVSVEALVSTSSGSFPALELTQQGAFIGTPAYMAPEQHLREPADAQSDQFSFCVALFEGLYGYRPFRGGDATELARAVLKGQRLDPPRDTEVPGWIAPILGRGLNLEPEDRYPNMAALLQALTADPVQARRRRWGVAGLVLAGGLAAGGGGYVVHEVRARDAAVCAGGRARLEEVWDADIAGSVRAAFTATRLPHADDVAARVQERVDDYAGAWVAAHASACETHRRGEQSDALYDRRMACLDDRRAALGALVDVLAAAAAAVGERAVQAVDRLPLLARCGEARALLAESPPPEDPAVAAAVEALAGRLARAWALYQVGQFKQARAEVQPLRAELEALGHAPPLAEALHLEGLLADALGEYAASEATLVRAVATADGAGDDDRRALALGDLARAIGLRQARFAEGLRHGELARGVVQRLADRGPAEAALEIRVSGILLQQREFAAAEGHIARAIELCAQIYGETSTVFAAAVDAGATLRFLRGQYKEALVEYRRVEAIYRAAYGDNHPSLGKVLNNIGAVELTMFDYAAAERTFGRALQLLRDAHGQNHPSLAMVHMNLGQIALGQAQFPRAIAELRRSLAINEVSLPADHPTLGDGWMQLGQGHLAAGEYESAEQSFARALGVYERAFGAGHVEWMKALASIGEAQRRGGRIDEAERSFQRALGEFTGGPAEPALAAPEAGLGKLRLAQGRLAEAVKLLESALERSQRDPGARAWPVEISRTEFALAEALWRLDPTHAPRSRALAAAARTSLLRFDPRFQGEVAQIDEWLTRLPAPSGG